MELITESICVEEKKGPAITQVTFDETYYLPDYLPDFFSVILSDGSVQVEESRCIIGQVLIKGMLRFKVLYHTGQSEWKIASLEGEFPFQETLILETAGEFDMAQTEVVLEDLTIRMMNARKLNVRALVEIRIQARERKNLEIPVGLDQEEHMEVKTQKENYLELCYRGCERAKIREEVRIPPNKPNINQILWHQAQLMGMEIHGENGSVSMQGEIQIFLIYQGMEENRIQWLEQRVPYQSSLNIPEAQIDMIPYVVIGTPVFTCREQEDADGEPRVLLIETELPMDLRLYREKKLERLLDAYSLEQQLNLQREPVKICSLHMKNEVRCRVNDTLKLQNSEEEILQIGSGTGQAQVEEWKILEDGLSVEGTVSVKILYLSSSDSAPVGAVERLIPFQCKVDIPSMPQNADVELQTSLEHLSFLMKTGTELEVQAVISVAAMVTKMQEQEMIGGVETQALDPKWLEQIPGIAGVRLDGDTNLWEIAKKFHTTVADIRQLNHLEERNPVTGEKLLVVKQGLIQI
ncbi:SPOCS domain-containing protein [uncultured Eubacterium sp.]|mgnify:CR=1 FL=1|uniref:DUF3794 and LysM peptidoglycan-binding domain-containing protein n=1 Tax=uncultured Eubacterium sp. TaxID=165185 RepID=UPI0025ED997C|nr:SPOCS domain-containing protein [uncultured Eubacterium sp.]